MSRACICGALLCHHQRHRTHQWDGAGSVLELYTCDACRSTRGVHLDAPPRGCQCAGCDEAAAYLRETRCANCGRTVEQGHSYCSGCRDELAARAARRAATVGTEFEAVRRVHDMRRSA